jgi:hypothetical protein
MIFYGVERGIKMTSKRKVVFVSKGKRETEEEYQTRINKIIEEENANGYTLVSMEEKGGGIFLTFEVEVEG